METTKLTVRLPKQELDFAKRYARDHGVTVTALIDRYLSRLQSTSPGPIHPEVRALTGLVSESVDAERVYREHLEAKHR